MILRTFFWPNLQTDTCVGNPLKKKHPVDLYSVMVCPESPSWFWIKVQEKKNSSEAFSPPSLTLTQTKFCTTSSVEQCVAVWQWYDQIEGDGYDGSIQCPASVGALCSVSLYHLHLASLYHIQWRSSTSTYTYLHHCCPYICPDLAQYYHTMH